MKTLRCHVGGGWHAASGGWSVIVDPSTEQPIARVSSAGVDFGEALEHARGRGGPALREMTLGQRAALLAEMSKALQEHRDELIALSVESTGTTRRDAKFDIDGGIFTLSYYADLGAGLGAARVFVDGEGVQLGRSPRYWGQHVLAPRAGAAVLINAFNFPVWGFAEKAACALLAGMPVILKPATSSAIVADRAVEVVVERDVLPDGALSMICGSVGDLVDRLGPQDVLAFTGSAVTALSLRRKENLLASGTRVNIEADSLNAAVLGPDVEDEETWSAFVRDVVREITQKSGQKCTAVRRILVPRERLDAVREALVEKLGEAVVGNPRDESVTMGPLATRDQLDDAVTGVRELADEADVILGTGARVDGHGAAPGVGFYFGPTLLAAREPERALAVHRREVFGPVATLCAYDGSAAHAARLVARSEGSLVTSVYANDREWIGSYLEHGAHTTGRLYLGSEKVAGQLPGSGLAMPQVLHGGPGRAGGGEELGGLRGVGLYLQRVAVTGDRAIVEKLTGSRGE